MTELKLEPHSYFVAVGDYNNHEDIEIRRIRQRDGSWLWIIRRASYSDGPVLNRDFEWEYNSSPSNRRDEELERTRYLSLEEATAHLKRYLDMLECTEFVTDHGQTSKFKTRMEDVQDETPRCVVCGRIQVDHALKLKSS